MGKFIAFTAKFLTVAIAAIIFVIGLNLLTGLLYAPIGQPAPAPAPAAVAVEETIAAKPAAPAPAVEPAAAPAAPSAPAPTTKPTSLAERLKTASADKGSKVFRKCKACHTVDEGGKNRTGPNLYNIVGRAIAMDETFKYSAAMRAHATAKSTWSFDNLAAYLANPKAAVPGNKMAFAGVKKPKQIADLLLYLRSLSASPLDLP